MAKIKKTKNSSKTHMFRKFNDELYYYNRDNLGKKLETDCICITRQATLSSILINTHKQTTWSCHDVSIKQLEKLLKSAKKMQKHWEKFNKTCEPKQKVKKSFIHLNPELSFHVKYGKT